MKIPSTENWIKDLLIMVPLIRTRPSFPLSQSLPSGSFHKPLTLLHQRADRLKNIYITSSKLKTDLTRAQPLHLSQRNKDSHSQKNLYTEVHSSFTCHSPSLETTQMPFRAGSVKPTALHPQHSVTVSKKEGGPLTHAKPRERL